MRLLPSHLQPHTQLQALCWCSTSLTASFEQKGTRPHWLLLLSLASLPAMFSGQASFQEVLPWTTFLFQERHSISGLFRCSSGWTGLSESGVQEEKWLTLQAYSYFPQSKPIEHFTSE